MVYTVAYIDADMITTSRNVGKCGKFFYFVSSEQKLIQLDTGNIGNGEFEKEIWPGVVEDFIVRKSTKDGLRDNKYVDIAILTKNEGTVQEITIDTSKNQPNSVIATSREIKVSGSNELIAAAKTVSYWNNIIEIEANGAPSYLINGYISTGNQNICISLGHSTFVQIPSSSKLVSCR